MRSGKMGQIASYFKREKYIKWRLSLLSLGGNALLVPLFLAHGMGNVPTRVLACAFVVYFICVGFAVVYIVRSARSKFPWTAGTEDEILDPLTRRKLRRRLVTLKVLVAIYVVLLLYELWQTTTVLWRGALAAVLMALLLEAALIKALRRLQGKLKKADSAAARLSSTAGAGRAQC